MCDLTLIKGKMKSSFLRVPDWHRIISEVFGSWPELHYICIICTKGKSLQAKEIINYSLIDRFHKWRPVYYSFVYVLIRPTSLVLKEHFFCIFCVLTRLVGLISTETIGYFSAAIYAIGLYSWAIWQLYEMTWLWNKQKRRQRNISKTNQLIILLFSLFLFSCFHGNFRP